MKLTVPQEVLLDEIDQAGLLYVRTYSKYGRTVGALRKKGLVEVVEPDYSARSMHGYSVTEAGRKALGYETESGASPEKAQPLGSDDRQAES